MYKQYSSLNALFQHSRPEDTFSDSMVSSIGSLATQRPPPNTPEFGLEGHADRRASIDTLIGPLSAALTSVTPSDPSSPDSVDNVAERSGFIPVMLGSPRIPYATKAADEGKRISSDEMVGPLVEVQDRSRSSLPSENVQSFPRPSTDTTLHETAPTDATRLERYTRMNETLENLDVLLARQGKGIEEMGKIIDNLLERNAENHSGDGNTHRSLDQGNKNPVVGPVKPIDTAGTQRAEHSEPTNQETLIENSPSQNTMSLPSIPVYANKDTSRRQFPVRVSSLSLPSHLTPVRSTRVHSIPISTSDSLKIGKPNSQPATPPFTAQRPHNRVPSTVNLSLPHRLAATTTSLSPGRLAIAERCEKYLTQMRIKERERDDGSGRLLKPDVYTGGTNKGRYNQATHGLAVERQHSKEPAAEHDGTGNGGKKTMVADTNAGVGKAKSSTSQGIDKSDNNLKALHHQSDTATDDTEDPTDSESYMEELLEGYPIPQFPYGH